MSVPKCWQGPLWGESGPVLCWTQMVPVGSNDPSTGWCCAPLPTTAVPWRNGFEKGSDCCVSVRSEEKKIWETTLQTPRLDKKVREEVLQVQEERFSCSHGAGGEHGGGGTEEPLSHCSPPGYIHQGRWISLEGTAAHREPTVKHVYPAGLQSVEDNLGTGERCEEEGIAERTIIPSPCTLRWFREVKNEGSEVEPRERIWIRIKCYNFSFFFTIQIFYLSLNEFSPSWVLFCPDGNW